MSAVTYPMTQRHEWLRPAKQTCPECRGHGYNTMEIREAVTLYDQDWPVTVPVTCYKTKPCWRCRGDGMVREER